MPGFNQYDTSTMWARYERLKATDDHKNILIEELLTRYDYLLEAHKKECEDIEREREHNHMLEQSYQKMERDLGQMQRFMDRDPFVVVLIDGDGMVFQENLLREGEQGGRRAAAMINTALEEYLPVLIPDPLSEVKIVARVYANVKGLADVCYKVGIVDHPAQVEAFVRGFTRARTLFDFVDVGPGKDRADDKISGTFKLYLRDFHCRQILFGCSHDNGYARLLEEITTDENLVNRITLLEGVPFEKELADLPFKTRKFKNIFRETKINLYKPSPVHGPSFTHAVTTTPQLTSGNGASRSLSLPRSECSAETESHLPVATTWASTAARAAKLPDPPVSAPNSPPSAPRSQSNSSRVPRNRAGQRIDPPIRHYDKEEVQRVKKLKMCNMHFLRQACPFDHDCTHVHRYQPTPSEIETLRLVARMAPCLHGSACDDPKCIYGHRCPAPLAKDRMEKSTRKTCIFGEACKFPPELHHVDRTEVNVVRIGGM